jgi:uncharacterized protein YutE (UPF0331/DUF86 family)
MERTLKRQAIVPRLDGIQRDMKKLFTLGQLSFSEFEQETNFALAQFYLRQVLEGIFHIGSHILSRFPGSRSTEYKEIALQLGEVGIVEKRFAKTSLKEMAGYRNRLTHFYADVTQEELFNIINNKLADVEIFLSAIKNLVEHPEKFELTME